MSVGAVATTYRTMSMDFRSVDKSGDIEADQRNRTLRASLDVLIGRCSCMNAYSRM
jgi:hypothetical protein